jgi:adenylate cyclase
LRVAAQLIDAATGTHLWTERYDRSLQDIFTIQDEIARGIVAAVATRVLQEGEAITRRRPPQDMKAYDLFLQARELSDKFTPAAQQRARELFERARELDPTFARAYTGLAFNSSSRAIERGIGVPHDKDPDRIEALHLAEQALTLDPNDARVHYTLGFMCLTWRDFDRARRHLDLALSMNPNDAGIQIVWAWATACLGEPERALPAAELAIRLNPHHSIFYEHYLSRVLFLARRHAEAGAILERLIREAYRYHPRDLAWRAAACGHLGQIEEAQQCAARFVEAVHGAWHGNAAAGPAEYVNWLVEVSYLRRPEDEAHLRDGLRLAGLPA